MRASPVNILLVQGLDQLLEVKRHDLGVSVDLGKTCIDSALSVQGQDHGDSGRHLLDADRVGSAWTPPLPPEEVGGDQPALVTVHYDLGLLHDLEESQSPLLSQDQVGHRVLGEVDLHFKSEAHIHVISHH